MEAINKKEVRKHYSKLGLLYLVGAILTIAIQYGCIVLISYIKPEWFSNKNMSLLLSMLPLYIVAYPLFIFIVKRMPKAVEIEKNKLSAGQLFAYIILGYTTMYILNIIGLIGTTIYGILQKHEVENVLESAVIDTTTTTQMIVVVMLAPIFEEYIFRKLFIDRAVKYGEGIAIFLSGMIFALFHGNFGQAIYAFGVGALLSYIYVRTGYIGYTIVIHMMMNFLGTVVPLFITGTENIALITIYGLLIIITVLSGIVLYIVYLVKHKFYTKPVNLVPNGQRVFGSSIINIGMIIYILVFMAMIIYQLTF